MKPYMLGFWNGTGDYRRYIYVNMNQVCYIAHNFPSGSVLTFCAIMEDGPAYLVVESSPEEIFARMA